MDIKTLIILIVIVLVIIGLILNKPFRQQLLIKFRGRTDEIMSRDTSTPEGAKDYYNVVIREKEQSYAKAHTLYIEITGKLDGLEQELYQKKKDVIRIKEDIKRCINENKEDDATRLALRLETINSQIETLKEAIEDLRKSKDQQKEYRDLAEEELQKIKEEKDKVIHELEVNKQIIDIHQSMDSNNLSKESDRMLEKVRENAKKTKEKAKGSQIAYESSSIALDRKLEKESRENAAKEIIEKMKREMGK